MPRKSVPQECCTRVSHKSVPQVSLTRVPYKSVPQEHRIQECLARVSHKCQTIFGRLFLSACVRSGWWVPSRYFPLDLYICSFLISVNFNAPLRRTLLKLVRSCERSGDAKPRHRAVAKAAEQQWFQDLRSGFKDPFRQ